MIDADFFPVDPRKIRRRQIDLARRNLERLLAYCLFADRKFELLPGAGFAHDHLPHPQLRRQRDAITATHVEPSWMTNARCPSVST